MIVHDGSHKRVLFVTLVTKEYVCHLVTESVYCYEVTKVIVDKSMICESSKYSEKYCLW